MQKMTIYMYFRMRKMAQFIWYIGSTATAYWVGRNVMSRGANMALDVVLNSNANPEIKEVNTIGSIEAMLNTYKNLEKDHPAKDCYEELLKCVEKLKNLIERAKLKLSLHNSGYITRFRTFDATADNLLISHQIKEMQEKLDLFTKLIKLPSNPQWTMQTYTTRNEFDVLLE